MNELQERAKIFITPLIISGVVFLIWNLADLRWWNWWLFVPAILAASAQLLSAQRAPEKSRYNIGWLAFGFTFVLLGAPAALFVVLIAQLIEWIWRRYSWYILLINIVVYAVAVSGAKLIYEWIDPGTGSLSVMGTIGILAAITAFAVLYRLLNGSMIWLFRGQSLVESGSLNLFSLMIDCTLISLGAAAAFIWMTNPSAAIFSIIPLYLIYITFKVPALKRQVEIDPKTKLFDSRYLSKSLEKELGRAKRFDRPLALALGDLDLLRHINNSYGHLAGDAILCGVADLLQESFKGYDIVARFGGEEFAILMPETTLEEAYLRVEMVREAIEDATFEVSTSVTPIKVSISFGIAGREGDNQSVNDLINNADVALYDAKMSGRNITRIYSNDDIDYLFGLRTSKNSLREGNSIEDTSKEDLGPYKSDSLPKKSMVQPILPKISSDSRRKLQPWWMVYGYIGIIALVAIFLMSLIFDPAIPQNWTGLLLFAIIVILTEGFSIEVYLKEASISTSAAPILAGVLLFGPIGAIVLSIVVVGTTLAKKRSHLHRFIFNLSNQLIACFLISGLIMLINTPITTLPQQFQIAITITAGMAVYFSNTWLQSGVLSLSLGSSVRQVWKEQFSWLWPYYLGFGVVGYALILGYSFGGAIGVLAIMVPLMTLRLGQVQYVNRTKDVVNRLRTNNEELERQSDEISILNEELLLSLANSIDLRDPYTLGHSQQVTHIAVRMARELDLPPNQIEQIRKGGLLHDIGKLGIPDSILLKPGKLTEEEYEVIKQHPILGAEMLETTSSLHNLIPIVRHHHERFDGKGYPDKIVGHAIPEEARILAVADSVEAMASDRPYRCGLNLHEIIEELNICSGKQFDPRVVKIFIKLAKVKGNRFLVNSAHEVDQAELQQARVSFGIEYAWRNPD